MDGSLGHTGTRRSSKVYICSPRSLGMTPTHARYAGSPPCSVSPTPTDRDSGTDLEPEGVESSPPPRDTPHRTPPYQRREVSLLLVVQFVSDPTPLEGRGLTRPPDGGSGCRL